MSFGQFATTGQWGDRPSFPPELRCWKIKGERGEYRQYEVDDSPGSIPTSGWGTSHWLKIEGEHFVECKCLMGTPGEYPSLDSPDPVDCRRRNRDRPPRITVETDSEGKERKYFERITQCTPMHPCGSRSYGDTYVDLAPLASDCRDYARCCFSGKIRVDKDLLFSSEPCYDEADGWNIWAPITRSGYCGDYIKTFLFENPINTGCSMRVNCQDPDPPNENEDIKCDFEFYEGHPNDAN